jgi:hypothetical protein
MDNDLMRCGERSGVICRTKNERCWDGPPATQLLGNPDPSDAASGCPSISAQIVDRLVTEGEATVGVWRASRSLVVSLPQPGLEEA